jgi:transglutaminase-like putative cysteine protease
VTLIPGSGVVQYSVRHVTRFVYTAPISESIMEVRMQPRTDGAQHCLRFDLSTVPRVRPFTYRDFLGNIVHHFDVPGRHSRLTITAETLVAMSARDPLPERLSDSAWDELDAAAAGDEQSDALAASRFTRATALLLEFARELEVDRSSDPLTVLHTLTRQLYDRFAYVPYATHVDSPIDDALDARAGVCQDFAHIMIALARSLGIPCRYVSGYLSPNPDAPDRSLAGATHAWVEAWLPGLGWIGFDPTNNALAGPRHIVVAIGRDYGDVPPTRGVFKGEAQSELAVSVAVRVAADAAPFDDPAPAVPMATWRAPAPAEVDQNQFQQQAQQAQQQ